MVHIVNEVDEYIEHTHKQHIPLREKITKAFDEFLVSRALSDPASLKKLAQSFVNVRFKDRKSSMQNSVFYQVIYQAAQKKPQETARFLLTIGLTEKEARVEHKNIVTASVRYGQGLIKLIAKKKSAALVGAHVFGEGAAPLVMYFDLLMRANISLREIEETHHYPIPQLPTLITKLTAEGGGRGQV
jgi:hypothetical protein